MYARLILICIFFASVHVVSAQPRDEKLLADAVESLRKALVDPDKATLERLTSVKLTYGHSSGKIEDRAQFVETLVSGKSDFTAIKLSEQKLVISGNTATVRHIFEADINDGGKPGTVKLSILLVYNKKGTAWQLLARQAVKIS